jgi:uncharacterized paraquat-inducible protein A
MKICHWLSWKRFAPLLAVVVALSLAATAWACPTCKEGLAENDPTSQAMVSGYFYSILFMMAMPFVTLGTLGGLAYLSVRRAREAEALAATTEPTDSA